MSYTKAQFKTLVDSQVDRVIELNADVMQVARDFHTVNCEGQNSQCEQYFMALFIALFATKMDAVSQRPMDFLK